MSTPSLLLWIFLFTGGIVAAWWLTVRPGAALRGVATPSAVLVIVMAGLLCALALSGPGAGRPRAAAANSGPVVRLRVAESGSRGLHNRHAPPGAPALLHR